MTSRLKKILQDISPKPLSDTELESATRNLIGFAQCLLAMKQEILRNESSHTHESFNQDAGRGIELNRTKQPAF
ncbi:MAG: hypothetical protein NC218_04110 [Acetobacter sp.]|nr:hypothetical protein [Acetobacter sp.]